MEYTINAQGKKIGRVATQAAVLLIGKNRTDFRRNAAPAVKVKIINASKADVTNKKASQKVYKSYSGYPGGLRTQTMKKLAASKSMKEIFRKAVYGMLPTNKLRAVMIKNLIIEN